MVGLPYGPRGAYEVAYETSTLGDPGACSTLFLHGLAGSIDDTRPLASGVRGTRIFAELPGHGRSTGPDPLTYAALAEASRAVADKTGVRSALGVSLGAATLLRILAETPDRFDRVVLFLPAVADVPRSEAAVGAHVRLAAAMEAEDADAVAAALLRTQPIAVRDVPVAREWAARRAVELIAGDGDPHRWVPLAAAVPLDGLGGRHGPHGLHGLHGLDMLRKVVAPVLVIAQDGDPAHPVDVARTIAAAFPNGRFEAFDAQGALWGHRRVLRGLISPFLTLER